MPCRVPGAPYSGFWYPGLGVALAPHLFWKFNPQLLTFNFRSPTVTLSAQNRPSTTEYYCLVVTNAREWAMFARGLVSLHTPPLLGQKPSPVKSCVSISSKLIEIKGLQLQYFSHLRKTGGRGVLPACPERSRRVMPTSSPLELTEVEESLLPTPLFPLHTKIPLVSPFLPLHTRKQGGIPPGKCRRADIFDFSPDLSHFFPSAPQHRLHPAPREKQEGWPRTSNRGAKDAHPDRVGTGASQCYIQECRRRADPPFAKSVKLLIDILNRWGILGCCKAQSLIWREHLSGEAACFAIGGGIGLAKRA